MNNPLSDFILKNGKEFKPVKFPEKFAEYKGTLKNCYQNAFRMAHYTGLQYVEGHALSLIPTMHAWVTDGTYAFDPTWLWDDDKEREYFGIVFPFSYVRKITFERKVYGVLEAYDINYPLLYGQHVYNKDDCSVIINGIKY